MDPGPPAGNRIRPFSLALSEGSRSAPPLTEEPEIREMLLPISKLGAGDEIRSAVEHLEWAARVSAEELRVRWEKNRAVWERFRGRL